MQNIVLEKRREQMLHDWVVNKIRNTYVHVNDNYRNCQFEYEGWVK
jgi:peptidyl-prolyl cis-trans isomerase SurA